MITTIDPKISISENYREKANILTESGELPIDDTLEETEDLNTNFQDKVFIISGARVKEETIQLDNGKPLLVGKNEIADIVVDEPMLSNLQLAILKLGEEIYFIDRGVDNICQFNGQAARQAVCYEDERMIVKLGHTWLIYDGRLERNNTIDYNNPHFKVESAELGRFFSDFHPLIIGSHEICDIIIDDKKIRDFHAFFAWNHKGVIFEAMDNKGLSPKINDMKVMGSKVIANDCKLNFDEFEFNVSLVGNIYETVTDYFPESTAPSIAISVLDGPAAGARARLENGQYKIGSGDNVDFPINDPGVSNLHAEIKVRNGTIGLEDKGSLNKTYVNGREIKRAMTYAGDIISFGECSVLVYYRL